jgi:hypothetical protein
MLGNGVIGRAQRSIHRMVRSLEFGLAAEFEWPSWAVSTRMGRVLPRQAPITERVLAAEYSLDSFVRYRPLERTTWVFHALGAIPDRRLGHIPIIGPRFANERFLARGLGYHAHQIRMLDTYSYSRHVDVGDMHDMPYPDDSFSAVVCGWTLAYSATPEVAAREITRVLQPGGHLVLGMDTKNAEGQLIAGWDDLCKVLSPLAAIARLESEENIVAVFRSAPERIEGRAVKAKMG